GRLFVFFFQAEDGIRDRNVTGVQTCALPISPAFVWVLDLDQDGAVRGIDLERALVRSVQKLAYDAVQEELDRGEGHPTMRLLQRSEEHTSELQSRFDLVCRLLLEKKKKQHGN